MVDANGYAAIIAAVITTASVLISNRQSNKYLGDKIDQNKVELLGKIKTEKEHAMSLASQRLAAVEEDVREIFPRLRKTEDDSNKNCILLSKQLKDCEKNHKANGGTSHV